MNCGAKKGETDVSLSSRVSEWNEEESRSDQFTPLRRASEPHAGHGEGGGIGAFEGT